VLVIVVMTQKTLVYVNDTPTVEIVGVIRRRNGPLSDTTITAMSHTSFT